MFSQCLFLFYSHTEFAIYNGFEYYIAGTDSDDTDDFLEFDASRQFCVDWGGQLTSILSQGEADFLTSHMYVRTYDNFCTIVEISIFGKTHKESLKAKVQV